MSDTNGYAYVYENDALSVAEDSGWVVGEIRTGGDDSGVNRPQDGVAYTYENDT